MKYNSTCGMFVPDRININNCNVLTCTACMSHKRNQEIDVEISKMQNPLLINWNIIGNCTNRCIYCYGEDIRNRPYLNNEDDILQVIKAIKRLHPQTVVLSGGEPLLHKNISWIIIRVHEICNVILDTNGLLINENIINVIKQNDVHVRVSLDDYREEINGKVRKSNYTKSTKCIIDNIKKLQDNSIPVTIQTVLTPFNIDSLMEFGEKLVQNRIRFWRIQWVVPREQYFGRDERNLFSNVLSELKKLSKKHKDEIVIRISNDDTVGNSTVNINPQGVFWTRNTGTLERKVLCIEEPQLPELSCVMRMLDKAAHIHRYCGGFL